MTTRRWVVTDHENAIWLESLSLTADDLGKEFSGSSGVVKRTLREGLSQGVEVIEANNGAMAVTVLPTRGMGIWKGHYRSLDLGWNSPVRGPVHPAFVNLNDRGGLGWLTGFDEWIVRCGLDSHGSPGTDQILDNQGNPARVELTLHGKIANLPAHYVEVSSARDGTLTVAGRIEEAMLFGPRWRLETSLTTWPNSNRLVLTDRVTNLRSAKAEMELLYHCNFGPPLLEKGSRLAVPIAEMAPRDARAAEGLPGFADYADPLSGYVEQVYWFELLKQPGNAKTLAMLRNQQGDAAAVLRFNGDQLPCFSLWKNTGAVEDGYVTGLEPGTSYPNHKAIERKHGRLQVLAPGETRTFELSVEILDSAERVALVEDEIAELQRQGDPILHAAPIARFS